MYQRLVLDYLRSRLVGLNNGERLCVPAGQLRELVIDYDRRGADLDFERNKNAQLNEILHSTELDLTDLLADYEMLQRKLDQEVEGKQ